MPSLYYSLMTFYSAISLWSIHCPLLIGFSTALPRRQSTARGLYVGTSSLPCRAVRLYLVGTAVVIAHISKHPNVTGDLAWLAVAKRPVLSASNDVHVVALWWVVNFMLTASPGTRMGSHRRSILERCCRSRWTCRWRNHPSGYTAGDRGTEEN